MTERRPRIYVPITRPNCDELFDDVAISRLTSLGEVAIDHAATAESMAERAHANDVILAHYSSPAIPADLDASASLKLVAYAAGSVKRVVPRPLLERGIAVSQAAAAMAPAVAELSLTLALCLLRHVHEHDRALAASHDWKAARQAGLGDTFTSRRIGVVGAGRTGAEYIRLARALNPQPILVFDPFLTAHRALDLGVETVELDELFARSDLVAIHAPSTPQTHRMIGAHQLALLPDGAIVINTARSWVINENALLAEILSGRLRAGLDVFDTEPLAADSPFYDRPNVIVSPHRGGATQQTRHLQGTVAIDEIERFLLSQPLQHAVTLDNYDQLA
jgi:phosphoglycerate dehydrogenase-like enzyme